MQGNKSPGTGWFIALFWAKEFKDKGSAMITRTLDWISRKMLLVGGFFLVAMMALTCMDVIGRMFRHPVFGSYELISFMAAVVVAATLPDAHSEKRHIGVEIVVNKLSPKVQNVFELVTNILSLALFSLVTWRLVKYGLSMKKSGEVSMNLKLPEYIIIFVVGFGFLVFCASIIKTLVDTVQDLREG
ncbi:MAG: TRAP transporter small permease [Desulfovermiculus sp.]